MKVGCAIFWEYENLRRAGHIKRTVKYVYIHHRVVQRRHLRRHTDGVLRQRGLVDCDADKIRWPRREGMVLR